MRIKGTEQKRQKMRTVSTGLLAQSALFAWLQEDMQLGRDGKESPVRSGNSLFNPVSKGKFPILLKWIKNNLNSKIKVQLVPFFGELESHTSSLSAEVLLQSQELFKIIIWMSHYQPFFMSMYPPIKIPDNFKRALELYEIDRLVVAKREGSVLAIKMLVGLLGEPARLSLRSEYSIFMSTEYPKLRFKNRSLVSNLLLDSEMHKEPQVRNSVFKVCEIVLVDASYGIELKKKACAALIRRLEERGVRVSVVESLACLLASPRGMFLIEQFPELLAALTSAIRDEYLDVRVAATKAFKFARLLIALRGGVGVLLQQFHVLMAELMSMAEDKDYKVRLAAIKVFKIILCDVEFGTELKRKVYTVLISMRSNSDDNVRAAAIEVLGCLLTAIKGVGELPVLVAELMSATKDEDYGVRLAAVEALKNILINVRLSLELKRKVCAVLIDMTKESKDCVRETVVKTFGDLVIGPLNFHVSIVGRVLISMANDSSVRVRAAVITTLAHLLTASVASGIRSLMFTTVIDIVKSVKNDWVTFCARPPAFQGRLPPLTNSFTEFSSLALDALARLLIDSKLVLNERLLIFSTLLKLMASEVGYVGLVASPAWERAFNSLVTVFVSSSLLSVKGGFAMGKIIESLSSSNKIFYKDFKQACEREPIKRSIGEIIGRLTDPLFAGNRGNEFKQVLRFSRDVTTNGGNRFKLVPYLSRNSTASPREVVAGSLASLLMCTYLTLQDKDAVRALVLRLTKDSESRVRVSVARSLATPLLFSALDEKGKQFLLNTELLLVRDKNFYVREVIIEAFASIIPCSQFASQYMSLFSSLLSAVSGTLKRSSVVTPIFIKALVPVFERQQFNLDINSLVRKLKESIFSNKLFEIFANVLAALAVTQSVTMEEKCRRATLIYRSMEGISTEAVEILPLLFKSAVMRGLRSQQFLKAHLPEDIARLVVSCAP